MVILRDEGMWSLGQRSRALSSVLGACVTESHHDRCGSEAEVPMTLCQYLPFGVKQK
jgi:hypothetical protein